MNEKKYNINSLRMKELENINIMQEIVDHYLSNDLIEDLIDGFNNKEWINEDNHEPYNYSNEVLLLFLRNKKLLPHIEKLNYKIINKFHMNIELDNFIKFADRNSLIYKPSRYSNQFDNIIDTGNTVLFNKLYKLSILKPEHIISLAIILFKKGYKKESNNILDNNVLNTQQFTDEELFYNLISCNDYNFYMRIKPMFDISKLSLFYLKKQNDFYIKMFNKNISKDINNHIEAKIKKLEDDFNFKISHTGEMYYLPQYNIELFPKRLKIIIRKLLETQNKSSLNVNYFNYIISSINYLLIHYSNINIDLLCNRLEFINKSLFLDNTYTQRNINYYKPFCMRNNHSDYFIYYNQKRFLKLYFPDSYILSIYSLRFYNNKYLFLKRNGYEDKDILKRKPSSLTSIEKHINALYLKEVQKKLPLRARKH